MVIDEQMIIFEKENSAADTEERLLYWWEGVSSKGALSVALVCFAKGMSAGQLAGVDGSVEDHIKLHGFGFKVAFLGDKFNLLGNLRTADAMRACVTLANGSEIMVPLSVLCKHEQ